MVTPPRSHSDPLTINGFFCFCVIVWGIKVEVILESLDLKQSPRVWFTKFSTVIQEFGMTWSENVQYVSYRHSHSDVCIFLVVSIVITNGDQEGSEILKQHPSQNFHTKDLGKLQYFLGIEAAQSRSDIAISQQECSGHT